jgi:prepilin-type N-terminal cleavage/methylation domain-containing protein
MKGIDPHRLPGDGNQRLFSASSDVRGGFTLLEMCMVLFIIAILFGVTMPAIQSAFTEQAVRKDSHQLALMVKTAMIQSAEQHRNYVIDLTNNTMALHPADPATSQADTSADTSSGNDTDTTAAAGSIQMEDVVVTDQLDAPNKLLAPDPIKPNAWVDMPDTSWVFQPGELCPATRIRLSRGDAWLEMSFNALTGNVENETASFP